jgi:RNA polymerase sigma-70 factor (ECF subfamily)
LERRDANKIFYDLLWPHAPAVLRMAQFLTHHRSEAEDIAQETLLKAFKALDRFRPGTDAAAWLIAILRNTWIDRVRSVNSKRETASTDDGAFDEPAAPSSLASDDWANAEDVLQEFSDQDVIDALRKLPDEIRWTLLLVDVQGLDHHAAADTLEVPVGTIKSRAHRGRAMLREVLRPKARDLGLLPRAAPARSSGRSEVIP